MFSSLIWSRKTSKNRACERDRPLLEPTNSSSTACSQRRLLNLDRHQRTNLSVPKFRNGHPGRLAGPTPNCYFAQFCCKPPRSLLRLHRQERPEPGRVGLVPHATAERPSGPQNLGNGHPTGSGGLIPPVHGSLPAMIFWRISWPCGTQPSVMLRSESTIEFASITPLCCPFRCPETCESAAQRQCSGTLRGSSDRGCRTGLRCSGGTGHKPGSRGPPP